MQREASSDRASFQLVALGPFPHLKSLLDTRQPFYLALPMRFHTRQRFPQYWVRFAFKLTIQKLLTGQMASLRFRFQLC